VDEKISLSVAFRHDCLSPVKILLWQTNDRATTCAEGQKYFLCKL